MSDGNEGPEDSRRGYTPAEVKRKLEEIPGMRAALAKERARRAALTPEARRAEMEAFLASAVRIEAVEDGDG